MNAARYFMRREDYQPPKTATDSPFRRFMVSCLKCNSVKLRVIAEHEDDSSELKVYLYCPNCREPERLPLTSDR